MAARQHRLVPIAASAGAVAAVTVAIYPLKLFAPTLSLGALYVLAVLPIAVLWGLAYAVPVSVASMVAFNFFHLPPLHTFELREAENWFALGVYLVTAIVVSGLADRARRRAVAAREAEVLRASDAVKTTILRAVGHDFRSPLTTISTAAAVLQDENLAQEDRVQLAMAIADESARLKRVVENLLDLSRLEAGAAQPARELWPLDALVLEALADVRETDRVVVSLPDEVPVASVDPAQIQRVLVNVLENALKFSPGTTVDVTLATQGEEAIIRVRDHGPGLGDAPPEHLFEAFEHGTGSHAGTGLGLAIARGFAQANGGRIWAENASGGGAVFAVALPLGGVAERAHA
jgi:K+-sensing histidine kinase KdpD